MTLQRIYVARHGHRLNWHVDHNTGRYSSMYPNPTGIPNDTVLASYGKQQAQQLAAKVVTLNPPPSCVYSSPFYRCIQTITPSYQQLKKNGLSRKLRVDPGLGEFFGTATFEHPAPAAGDALQAHFDDIEVTEPTIVPYNKGETIENLHDRVAYALHRIIEQADKDGIEALIICTHAAVMIALGRVLTGKMPEDRLEDDFRCGTCSLSTFERRLVNQPEVERWDSTVFPPSIPRVDWRGGKGVQGGWDCLANGDCSFLSGGEERSWRFTGDESFLSNSMDNLFDSKSRREGKESVPSEKL